MGILDKMERKLALKRIPFAVTFEVTKKCNLDCVHCYVDHRDTKHELSIKEQMKIIDELDDLGVVYITFSGGELFNKEGVWDLFEYTRSKNMGFKVITSATTLTKPQMEYLKELGILEVGISIYSDKEEVHDKITKRKGSLKKSVEAATYLSKMGVKVVSKTLIMNVNYKDIRVLYDMMISLGIIPTFDLSIINSENNVRDTKKYSLKKSDIYQLFKDKEVSDILLDSKSMDEYCNMNYNFQPEDPRCSIARSIMWIDSKGDVYPCLVYPEPLGSLKTHSLKDIWYNSDKVKEVLELSKYKNYLSCHVCKANPYCSPCIAMTKLENRKDSCSSGSYYRAFANKELVEGV